MFHSVLPKSMKTKFRFVAFLKLSTYVPVLSDCSCERTFVRLLHRGVLLSFMFVFISVVVFVVVFVFMSCRLVTTSPVVFVFLLFFSHKVDLPGGQKASLTTNPSKKPSGADANFLEHLTVKLDLPADEIFAPRLKLRIVDHRLGG